MKTTDGAAIWHSLDAFLSGLETRTDEALSAVRWILYYASEAHKRGWLPDLARFIQPMLEFFPVEPLLEESELAPAEEALYLLPILSEEAADLRGVEMYALTKILRGVEDGLRRRGRHLQDLQRACYEMYALKVDRRDDPL